MTTEVERIVMRCRTLEEDHHPDGWPAVQMKDITALCDEVERLKTFKFELGDTVMVKDSAITDEPVFGEIVSKAHYHTGGVHYAVYGNYKIGREGRWFSEREISAA